MAAENQTGTLLKGRILDNEMNPLPGAVVRLDGDRHTAVSDAEGFYSIPNFDIPSQ